MRLIREPFSPLGRYSIKVRFFSARGWIFGTVYDNELNGYRHDMTFDCSAVPMRKVPVIRSIVLSKLKKEVYGN